MLNAASTGMELEGSLLPQICPFNTFCLSRDGECLIGSKLLWFNPIALQCAAECCIVFVWVGVKSPGRDLEQKWDYVKSHEMSSTFHDNAEMILKLPGKLVRELRLGLGLV